MRAPLSWVAESVDLPPDTTPRQLGDALVRVGLEVERVAAAADAVGGPVVIGRVWSIATELHSNGKTFRWFGRYDYDLNVAHTLDTQLNVFADFEPKLSVASKSARLVFLGNIQPDLQRGVREQVPNAELVALDTMNLWIDIARDSLMQTIKGVDVVIINDAESRQLTGIPNLIKAARTILSWGPKALIVKRGEYGAALFTEKNYFAIPAYPLESVFDPTGAGDTFAGGLAISKDGRTLFVTRVFAMTLSRPLWIALA